MIREQWSGGEWEAYCRRLLSMRYDSNIQFIPARDRGDGGLEAFRFDGVGYQCYAPEDAYTMESQTTAQKRKMTKDLKRLCDDVEGTCRLLGDVRLHTWILMTPEFDSRSLVEHAQKKKKDVSEILPRPKWLADEFKVVVITDEEFASERTRLLGQVETELHLSVPDPDESLWNASEGNEIADRVAAKLSVVPSLASDPEWLIDYRDEMLRVYFRGQAQMDRLKVDYPPLYAAVERRLKSVLSTLTMTVSGMDKPGTEVIETLVRRLSEGLKNDAPGLSRVLCDEIAWHAVSSWLIRCPLRFRRAA
ncbi:hypothetical protein GCM10010347_64400 [Streptomyces cirratus]|uniref:Uncharacterized protein n=1 Tax=Streptomyces cirratus TaxID=68187 RepID=A0ABQ3F578_9ACTN|nr:hypothetical protein [Streptomyces cirratus]GHB84570.1 hypothetical protein GCM10010347_64400 [Streptomyces cirratus]